jgi:hypothetical protein
MEMSFFEFTVKGLTFIKHSNELGYSFKVNTSKDGFVYFSEPLHDFDVETICKNLERLRQVTIPEVRITGLK